MQICLFFRSLTQTTWNPGSSWLPPVSGGRSRWSTTTTELWRSRSHDSITLHTPLCASITATNVRGVLVLDSVLLMQSRPELKDNCSPKWKILISKWGTVAHCNSLWQALQLSLFAPSLPSLLHDWTETPFITSMVFSSHTWIVWWVGPWSLWGHAIRRGNFSQVYWD